MARMRPSEMQAITIAIVIILGLPGKVAMAKDSGAGLKQLVRGLPNALQGWSKSAESEIYSAQNLYEYINGGAELYNSYQFGKLITQPYVRAGGSEIKIDIFDMGSCSSAFGVFTHSRESVDRFVSPQVESEYAAGLLTFWQGRYYVAMLAYPETEEKRLAVKQLAQLISGQIKEESKKPDLVFELPQEGLVANSIRYFRHHTWLNTYHFFANENILNIDAETEAVMGRFNTAQSGDQAAVLVLLRYTDAAKARAAGESFQTEFMPDAENGFKQTSNRRWTACVFQGNRVTIVADAPDRKTAEDLLGKVLASRRPAEDEGD